MIHIMNTYRKIVDIHYETITCIFKPYMQPV